ncbi:MAG: hypothetical protein QNK38_01420, partial [Nitrospirota bacterium]|nr:hypothetical protein [Nitrospirota bacterium]MDX2419712.1 hypothetical protein [Nitrospirota bacterium]
MTIADGNAQKIIQSCPEPRRRKGRSDFDAWSVLPVREHDKMATCLREALRRRQGTLLVAFFNIPISRSSLSIWGLGR